MYYRSEKNKKNTLSFQVLFCKPDQPEISFSFAWLGRSAFAPSLRNQTAFSAPRRVSRWRVPVNSTREAHSMKSS